MFLATVLAGPEAWQENETLRKAIEIRDGVIQNQDVLQFQRREADYPHRALS